MQKELRRIVKIFCVTGQSLDSGRETERYLCVEGVWWIFEFIGANITWYLYGRSCFLDMFMDVPCMLIVGQSSFIVF